MALIKCPECGKEISDKSPKCVNCGYPLTEGSKEQKNNKHKKIFLIIALFIICVLISIVIIFSISNKVTTENQDISTATNVETTYDKLSPLDKKFFDTFIKGINTFYNPKSVIIKYIYGFDSDGNHMVDSYDITVSAENQMGGHSEEDYTVYSDGTIKKPILPHIDMGSRHYNLDLINKAIVEHFE